MRKPVPTRVVVSERWAASGVEFDGDGRAVRRPVDQRDLCKGFHPLILRAGPGVAQEVAIAALRDGLHPVQLPAIDICPEWVIPAADGTVHTVPVNRPLISVSLIFGVGLGLIVGIAYAVARRAWRDYQTARAGMPVLRRTAWRLIRLATTRVGLIVLICAAALGYAAVGERS